MSTREDQPVTVPPPAGEDDAYSATTKVGAMPADIRERLRAEGLLPDEDTKDTPPPAMRPSTSLDRRQAALVSSPAASDGAPMPTLYSTAPPALTPPPGLGREEALRESQSKILTKPPPPTPDSDAETPQVSAVADAIDTPVAFAFPPVPKIDELEEASVAAAIVADDEATKDTTALTRQPAKKGAAQAPSKTTMVVVGALVVVLLIVALMRLRG